LFVLAVWAALSLALIAYVMRYGANVPYMDDWELVPVLTHARPITWNWIWIQQNEHRFPLVKLALFGLGAATGGDYRSGMVASALVLSAAVLVALRVARRLRGGARYADAVFPLALLHWGHQPNLLAHLNLFFVVAGALMVAATALIAGGRWRTSPRGAAALCACLILLPLHGAVGLTLALPLALWASYAGYRGVRAPEPGTRRAGYTLLGGSVAVLVLAGAYFIGFSRPPYHPTTPSAAASLRSAAEVLAVSLGPVAATAWPWSAAIVIALCAATSALLLAALRLYRAERTRALGLLTALAAVCALASAIGFGRAGFGPGAGFESRYTVLAVPILAVLYFAWDLYGGAAAGFGRAALFAVTCAAFSISMHQGAEYGRARREQADRLWEDVRAGVLPDIVAKRHWRHFYPSPAVLARRLRMLHEAGHGPYSGLPPAPAREPCRAWEPTPPRQIGAHNMQWRDGVGRPEGPDPYLVLGLTDPERLCAVRLTFVHHSATGGEAPLKVYWALASAGWFSEGRHWETKVASRAEPQTVVVWINDEIDLLRVDPDEGTTHFRVTGLELLSGS
jgi:hypothetical protein